MSFCADNNSTLFDASQYEFFGQSLEEVELGGLDDDASVLGGHADDEEYHLFDKREVICFLFFSVGLRLMAFIDETRMRKHLRLWFQGAGLGSVSDMDDLATTFAKVSILLFTQS